MNALTRETILDSLVKIVILTMTQMRSRLRHYRADVQLAKLVVERMGRLAAYEQRIKLNYVLITPS
jgi:cytochrome c-type biogenesis protein CcmH/NrfF